MFESATHFDVRVEVIERMTRLLSKYSNDPSQAPLVACLMTVMESIVTLVGGPDERKLTTDKDWTIAEQSDTLPEIVDEGLILNMLLANVMSAGTSIEVRRGMMRRVILPVITQSIEMNARWYKIFARKYSLGSVAVPHASYPIRTTLLEDMVARYPEWVPLQLLQLYHRYLVSNFQPSPEIQEINEKVLADPVLRSSNAGAHWQSQYDQGFRPIRASTIVKLLTKEWRPSLLESGIDEDGFQVNHVQNMVQDISYKLLIAADHYPYNWVSFTCDLAPPLETYHRVVDQQAWLANGKPVVERLIRLVSDARASKAWKDSPERRPSVLPSTNELTLWLLPYPCLQAGGMDTATRCTLFTEALVKQIESLSRSSRPFHKHVKELTAAALKLSSEDRIRVGYELGALAGEEEAMAMADFMRLELAEQLLKDASKTRDEGLRDSVKKAVQAWVGSGDEEVRRIGLRNDGKV